MSISLKSLGWTGLFAAIAGTILVFGMLESTPNAAPPAGGGMPPLEVSTEPVRRQSVPVYLEYVGTTEAVRSVTLQAKATGHLVEQVAPDGADVKQGDLLYRIDPRDYQAAIDQAAAQLKRDAAARDYARSRESRSAKLARDGWVAKDALEQNTSTVSQYDAIIAADEAAIRTARLRLSYTEIRAPFAGRLSRSLVHEGALISGDAGTRLNTLVQLDPIHVTFSPSEADLASIQRGQAGSGLPVEVRLASNGERVYRGAVTFLDNTVDRKTGTIAAQAAISNADLSLLPGQYVRVRILVAERPNALLAPKIAVGSNQLGKFVYVVGNDGKVAQRPVTLGRDVGERVVVETGVGEGELVITDNLQKIGPGAPVRPRGAVASGN